MKYLMKIYNTIRYGLFFNELRYRLGSIGIIISPFYWTQERKYIPEIPKNGLDGYAFGFFGPEEMKEISEVAKNHSNDILVSRLNEGKKCFGAKHNGQIAAFIWFDLDECNHKFNTHPLGSDEAYIFDAYTLKNFRGCDLAPFLGSKVYQELQKLGKKKIYSIIQATNTSAIKFKHKRRATFLWFGLYISLFKKIHWSFVLKRYDS